MRWKLAVMVVFFSVTGLVANVQASIIGFTSFEEPDLGGEYTDTLGSTTNHALINNTGEMPVNYTSVGGELGFSSYYTSTGGSGLADGDFVGVTDFAPKFDGNFTDGDQAFQMQDTDGIMVTTLDPVNLTGYTNASISMDLFVMKTGWEPVDVIRAYVTVDGGKKLDLIDTTGRDINDLGIEDSWKTLVVDLNGYTTAQLSFMLEANSADETIWIDNIKLEGTAVPIPAAVWLLGSGIIGLIGFRRKFSKR